MYRFAKGTVLGWMLCGVLLSCARGEAPAGSESRLKETAMNGCFADSGVNLGVPADAAFFLAEVDDGMEPLGNRRWAIGPDGTTRFGRNEEPFDSRRLPVEPFNRPFQSEPIAKIPEVELQAFLAWLESSGFFAMPPVVDPPQNLVVKGGVDRWVMARLRDRSACVRLRPGAPGSDELKARLSALVSPRLTPGSRPE